MLLLVQLDSHKTIYLAISNRGPQSMYSLFEGTTQNSKKLKKLKMRARK